MTALHIVSTALAPTGSGAALPADPALDATQTPFFALLGEQLEAGIAASTVTERAARDEVSEDAAASQAAFDPATLGLGPVSPATATPAEIGADAASQWSAADAPRKTEELLTPAEGRDRKAAVRGTTNPLAATDAAETLRTTATPSATQTAFDAAVSAASNDVAPVTHAASAGAAQALERAAQPVQLQLQQPVGSERWNTEVGQQVQLLIRTEQHSASLRVTPPELGPVDVRIDLSGDQATVSFTVQQADTRQALENALPRLRDLLAEGGILLGQAHVNQDSGDQREAPARSSQGSNAEGSAMHATGGIGISAGTQRSIGLVDTFA